MNENILIKVKWFQLEGDLLVRTFHFLGFAQHSGYPFLSYDSPKQLGLSLLVTSARITANEQQSTILR